MSCVTNFFPLSNMGLLLSINPCQHSMVVLLWWCQVICKKNKSLTMNINKTINNGVQSYSPYFLFFFSFSKHFYSLFLCKNKSSDIHGVWHLNLRGCFSLYQVYLYRKHLPNAQPLNITQWKLSEYLVIFIVTWLSNDL